MANDDIKQSDTSNLINSALRLEFKTDAGNYNVIFTLGLFILTVGYSLVNISSFLYMRLDLVKNIKH